MARCVAVIRGGSIQYVGEVLAEIWASCSASGSTLQLGREGQVRSLLREIPWSEGARVAWLSISISVIPAAILSTLEYREKHSLRQEGAQTGKAKTADLFDAAFTTLGQSTFKSDAAADAFRLAIGSEQSSPAQSSGTGEWSVKGVAGQKKRSLAQVYDGVSAPSLTPMRRIRKEHRETLQQNSMPLGFHFLVANGPASQLNVASAMPLQPQDLVGLLPSIPFQLQHILECCVLNGLLTDTALKPSLLPELKRLKLPVVFASDGTTPTNVPLLNCTALILDPQRQVFRSGAAPMIRLCDVWLPEGSMTRTVVVRNQNLSDLLNLKYVLAASRARFRMAND